MTAFHYFCVALGILVLFGAGYASGWVSAMQKRIDKADEACLEDEDMQDTQRLEP